MTEVIRVNAAFKGGGAKGIAYAGALRSCRERGVWFGSVAGASAGAITATLIAAGLNDVEIEDQVPIALGRLNGRLSARLGRVVLGLSTSLFDSRGLYEWLDDLLRQRTGASTPVSFRMLYAREKIELYVVVMNLATATPTVFSRLTTPDVDVAGAVVASCAIPGAFPAGRAIYDHEVHGATVHQLVDGGAWANYPMFVFKDRSFRQWVLDRASQVGEAVDEAEDGRETVGFVLGDPADQDLLDPAGFVTFDRPGISRRFDLGPTFTSESTPMSIGGAILGTDWCRAIVGLAALVWMVVSITLLPVVVRQLATWLDWLPTWLYPIAFVGLVSVVVLAAAGTFAVIIGFIAVSRMVADTILPAGSAALGVATGVAPWAGSAPDDVLVVVPTGGLETTKFVVSEDARRAAVDGAHRSVTAQLDDGGGAGKLWPRVGRDAVPVSTHERDAPERQTPDRPFAVGVAMAAGAALIGGLGGWWAANVLASTDSWVTVVLLALLIVGGVGLALVYVGRRTGLRRARRSRLGVSASDRPVSRKGVAIVAAVGCLSIVGGLVVAGSQMDDRDMLQAEIVASETVDDATVYTFVADERIEGTLSTDRPLRVGDDVLVSAGDEPGTWTLAEPLPSAWFGVSIALTVFGFGLITSAIKRRAWATRCRRLSERLAVLRQHGANRATMPPSSPLAHHAE